MIRTINNITKVFFHLFILASISLYAVAQDTPSYGNIFFGDVDRSKNIVRSIAQTNNGDILCVQSNSSFFSKNKKGVSFSFDLVQNWRLPEGESMRFFGDGRKATPVNYAFLGNSVLALSYTSTMLQRGPKFFFHILSPELGEKSNHGFDVSIFNSRFKDVDYSRLYLRGGKKSGFATAFYMPRTRTNENASIKYAVFEEGDFSPHQDIISFPYSTHAFEIIDFYAINKEKQLLITGHYPLQSSKVQRNTQVFFDRIEVNTLGIKQDSPIEISSPGVFFIDAELLTDDNKLTLYGLYTTRFDGNPEGIFFYEINEDGEVIESQLSPLPTHLQFQLNEYVNNMQINSRFSDVERSLFKILEVKRIGNDFISVVEFEAIERRYSGADMPGTATSIDTYFWSGDLLVLRSDTEGKLHWTQRIPKAQRTINDGGYFLSTATFFEDDYLHLFFNDSHSNYDEDDNYSLTGERPDLTKFGNLKNAIAHVAINLNNGESQRKSALGKADTKVVFVPRLSIPLEKENKLFIYGVNGNRHRFGMINFSK